MNTILPDVSSALETVRLALFSLSPVEAVALALGWAAFAVAVTYRPRPVVSLNTRLADEAGLAAKPSS
ncbi:hypothetical protein [Nocardiopsis synnemataformans]|uniref:hypothetical protein n=1 Tax=Nocardiopsis synnemataformans TaxID=61305 RepID=UPI003EC0D27B